jgi:Holliday junction DNA helicase RuvA
MLSYISGIVDTVEKDKVIIDNNGIGYGIFMPQSALELLGEGEEVKIYTYFSVREDAMQLFGFLTKEELNIFKLLIGVSGVGPKGAIAIISACPEDSLSMAIISGDAKTISKAQGIGNKTAQRIIIELKDKLDLEEIIGVEQKSETVTQAGTVQSDAIEALVSLGYSQSAAFNAVKKVKNPETMDVEELLKTALKLII